MDYTNREAYRNWGNDLLNRMQYPYLITLTLDNNKEVNLDKFNKKIKLLSNKVSYSIFKHAYKKFNKKLNGFGFIESINDNPHCHLIMDKPEFIPESTFSNRIGRMWHEITNAKIVDIREIDNRLSEDGEIISKVASYVGKESRKMAWNPDAFVVL